MTMLKSENLLDHDGRWVTSDNEEHFPSSQHLVSFESCQEAIDYAKANPDEFQTHVGRVRVCTPERLVFPAAIANLLEDGRENFMEGLHDTDPEDVASWTPEHVEGIRQAVIAIMAGLSIVRPFYVADSITGTGVPDEFQQADAAEEGA